MIKLTKKGAPTQLTQNFIDQGKIDFSADKKSRPWAKDWIRSALKDESNNKCSYCEQSLGERGLYLEVEHFYVKSVYEDKILDWNNLLASCKTCNLKKSTLDVGKEPIINPFFDEPKSHLKINRYRYEAKTDLGEVTILSLDLNNYDSLSKNRFALCYAIQDQIKALVQRVQDIGANVPSTRVVLNIRNKATTILQNAQPDHAFSASVATEIIGTAEFIPIKEFLEANGEWNQILSDLYDSAKDIAMLD
mgnify:CR=1 FL=1